MPFTVQQATEFVLQQLASLDFWTFVVAVLALLATVWYGRAELRFARQEAQTAREETEQTLRNQEEQLQLARREAENRPLLEVTAIDLIHPVNVEAVVETAEESKKALEQAARYEFELQQYEKKRKEIEQERKKYPFAAFDNTILIRPQNPNLLHFYYNYEGPNPDWVLRVTVVNKGMTAALDVSGQLYLDPSHLEPLDFPGLDGNVELQNNGTPLVNVSSGEGSRLLGAPTNEELTFDVAVLVKQPGATDVRYAFTTPQGDHVEDSGTLHVPSPT